MDNKMGTCYLNINRRQGYAGNEGEREGSQAVAGAMREIWSRGIPQ